jgi:hypothetical protein
VHTTHAFFQNLSVIEVRICCELYGVNAIELEGQKQELCYNDQYNGHQQFFNVTIYMEIAA